jgi:hypothetical protein
MTNKESFKLLNGSKQEVTYTDVETVTFPATTGGENVVTFTAGKPLDELPIELDLSDGDQTVEVPEGYVARSAVVTKPDGMEAVIAKGETLAGVNGEYVTEGTSKKIELDFSDDEEAQTVTADGDERWSEIVVEKPETLVAENIAKDVEIAGVVGKLVQPQLNAFTASIASGSGYHNITLTNPSGNGTFASSENVYINDKLVSSVTPPAAGSSVTHANVSFYSGIDGDQTISFELAADGFLPSERYNYSTSMVGVTLTPDTVSDDYDYPAVETGTTYSVTINQKDLFSSTGYLPVKPTITMGAEPQENYTWTRDVGVHNGLLTHDMNAKLSVPNVTAPLVVNMPTTSIPVLAPPQLAYSDGILTITPQPYTEKVQVYLDGNLLTTLNGVSYSRSSTSTLSTSAFNYYGVYNTYVPTSSRGYYLETITLTATETTSIVLRAAQSCSYSPSYNYLVLSNLDTSLSANSSSDGSSSVKLSLSGTSASSSPSTATYSVPAGTHTIQAKIRLYSTSSSYSIIAGFGLYTLCNTKTITLDLPDDEVHVVTAIASGASSGCKSSDYARLEVQRTT